MSIIELRCEYCHELIDKPYIFCHECTNIRRISNIIIPNLPLKLGNRVQGKHYMFNGKIVICKGGVLNCIHGIRRTKCNDINCINPSNNCIHEIPIKHCSICMI